MAYGMRCLLCEPGSEMNPPYPRHASTDLIAMQRHVMDVHGYGVDDLQNQKLNTIGPGYYEYTMPDGWVWLSAKLIDDSK